MSNKPIVNRKIRGNRTMAALIALFLVLTMAISLVALPTANAQPTKKTYAYIGATPNPIGVGQQTLIHLGITDPTASTQVGWQGLTVTVTRPDGTTETLGPFTTDSTGGTGTVYVPSMVGNYTLQTHFPQQVNPTGSSYVPVNTTLLASDSDKLTLVVQQEPIQFYPSMPLPTEYWTRPIDDQLREWSPIGGSWLTSPPNLQAFGNEYAPESAHILWVKPLTSGGQVGGTLNPYEEALTQVDTSGQSGQVGYDPGDAYEGKWIGSLIMGGKLYYQKYATADPYKEIICVDLHTGEQLWSKVLLDNRTLSRGQLFYWQTYDFYGVYDYLWTTGTSTSLAMVGANITSPGTIWCAFDPFTGDFVYAMYGIPAGTVVYGPHGELLIYQLSLTGGYMYMWNSSNIPQIYASTVFGSMAWGQWRAMGKILNATGPNTVTNVATNLPYRPTTMPLDMVGYQWNKTIPTGLPGGVRVIWQQDRVIGALINQTDVIIWGISLKPGQEGQLLYKNQWKAPADWLAGNQTIEWMTASLLEGQKVGVLFSKETRQHYGFSLETGEYLWGPTTPPQYYLDFVDDTKAGARAIAYGRLYCASVSGIVYCYDVKTGKLLWTYEAVDPYTEILWANTWWMRPLFITDGKIYVGHYEHSGNQPLPRGAPFICLNATTGEEIFRINGAFRSTRWGGRAVIGDSIIATMDTYDQRVYAIGKGPSATTVTASPKVSVHGSSVLVEGSVTDVSPGTKEYARTARFPSGVPAVSDESMSDWMLYVYKQFPRPMNATGVEVTLDTVDPNGNWVHIGTVTSDSSGMFKKMFTPEVPGEYTIIATFAGSKSYYASYAETAIGVEEAPPATPTPTPAAPLPPYEMYTIGAAIAIIIAVAIATILLLRKRP